MVQNSKKMAFKSIYFPNKKNKKTNTDYNQFFDKQAS